MVQLHTDIRSQNFDSNQIPVEFVVIHYTACSLKRAISTLCDQERKVSTHLVIDVDGAIFELVPAISSPALRAWHSGKSRWQDADKEWSVFNDFSIGIELVNQNGNIFKYPEPQYQSLIAVLNQLRTLYPNLSSSNRVIGHEQIAGFRGKSDPGLEFDWNRVLSEVYPNQTLPNYNSRLTPELVSAFKTIALQAPQEENERDLFFSKMSELMELL